MQKFIFILILISNCVNSQNKGIKHGTIGSTKETEVFFSNDYVVSKEIVYTNFIFEGELKKIDIDIDSIYIKDSSEAYFGNNSDKKTDYKQKYYLISKDNFFNHTFYGDYLKKNDTLFENFNKISFTKTEFDLNLQKRFLNYEIQIDKEDFIFELGKWQFQIKNLKEEKTEILIYYNFQFVNNDTINSTFLKEYFYFEEKIFLRFDHTIFWYALSQ